MTTTKIDDAIERYVTERKKSERKVAETKFLNYTYLACGENDAAAFMRRVRSLIRYYIDYLTVLENPLRGPQAACLALMAIVFSFGIYMLTDEEMRIAGVFITSGTSCIAKVSPWKPWRTNSARRCTCIRRRRWRTTSKNWTRPCRRWTT